MLRSALAATLISLSFVPAMAVEPGMPDGIVSDNAAIGIAVRKKLLSGVIATPTPDLKDGLDRFYSARNNEPLWLDGDTLNATARKIIDELKRADEWGLVPADYEVIGLDSLATSSTGERAALEARMSLAVARYARDARVGRVDPALISGQIDRGSTPPDPVEVLTGVAAAADPLAYLMSYHPQHPQFLKLREQYLAVRGKSAPAINDSVSDIQIPVGPKLKPGTKHVHVALLRKRLGVPVVDAVEADAEMIYDADLEAAVRLYQESQGLTVDGIVGAGMRQALNGVVSADPAKQVDRILANMERWRWVKEDFGEVHVWNNIPEFMTRVVDNGQVVFSERIVVGKPDTPTPYFDDQFDYVEFFPFWNVPDSIKVNELLPSLRRGGNSLAKQGLKVGYNGREVDPYSVDWSATDIRRFHVFQPPGPKNALGLVKFMFPNSHDVYMHDTPSKALFNENVRAFSHGCMRVRNPLDFAEVLMRLGKGWTRAQVEAQMAKGVNEQVPLDRKIPIHITYFTVGVDDAGKLEVRNDLYGHDRRVIMALRGETDVLAREVAAENASRKIQVAFSGDPGPSLFDSQDDGFFGGLFSSGSSSGNVSSTTGGGKKTVKRARQSVSDFFGNRR